ncbi:MAG: LysR family transcriptional regulator [Beijerinckiaceae bacterium]|nr:LysR family transcriptional regulator [Beijerinckiaceae bacterium]MCZ8301669.1 LysR family transcriptional regulator [Beijerinckiaceae bacterium]
MLTLRQIEVLRAVMVAGSVSGAARLLGVSAPGISRLMKYTERSVGLRLFDRSQGRFVPTTEAKDIFEQVNSVYKRVDDLQSMIGRMRNGDPFELKIGSVPSICNVMVPRAIGTLRRSFPSLRIDINVLKLEEAIDYILLGKGELVAMSYKLDNNAIEFIPLAKGQLFCIVPAGHVLAKREVISAAEMVKHPLIGIDPNDPYGGIMARIFARHGLDYDIAIRARFGTTVCSLVQAGLGIAMIDQFTVAQGDMPGLRILRIDEPTEFQTYIAKRRDIALSTYAESFVRALRNVMNQVIAER